MKALQNVIKDGLGDTCWHFCNKPTVLSTLVKIVLIWISKCNLNINAGPDVPENWLY